MNNELTFRLHETRQFLKAITLSSEGRKFLISHLFNTFLLTFVVITSIFIVLLTLHEGVQLRRRSLAISFSILFIMLVIIPMITMPFFSFKDVTNKVSRALFKREFFTNLSAHVFYHQSRKGEITLHLAKAHSILEEKYRLLTNHQVKTARKNISRDLALSISRSIRDAVRLSKDFVKNGRLKSDQQIVGATYGYLFGAAKSKLKLNRIEPGWFKRYVGNIFYRFGALHAVFMYFVINEKLPPSFDPVYFHARVGDVIGSTSTEPS